LGGKRDRYYLWGNRKEKDLESVVTFFVVGEKGRPRGQVKEPGFGPADMVGGKEEKGTRR